MPPAQAAVIMACLSICAAASAQPAQQWTPFTATFQSTQAHDNPYTVPFNATVTRPDGATFKTPGFHDGGNTWKLRVGPDMTGNWSLTTHSDDDSLDGKTVKFQCTPSPSLHGPLRVDPDHPHHFVHDDGARWFHLGYECDWLWALDMGNPELPTIRPFLDKLAANGFNLIVMNVYAHDCDWRKGKTGPDDYGPPPMYPWAGTNENPDHSRLNPPFWQHYDRVIHAMFDRGIQAHIMIKVYNKMVNWPAKNSPEEDLYLRTVVARYAPYPNVIWDYSKEAHYEKDVEYKLGFIRRLKELDPYGRLVTVHDDDALYNRGTYDSLLDYRSDQQHKDWHRMILRQRELHNWPVVNIEFGYEWGAGGENDHTYGVVQSAEENSRRAWLVATGGGYPTYYYTYTAWDVIRPNDTPPGYDYMRVLRDILEKTNYWEMKPADELVDNGHCLADRGKEYLVYLEKPQPVTFQLQADALEIKWFNALTGEARDAGKVNAGSITFEPPSEWAETPLVLHVKC